MYHLFQTIKSSHRHAILVLALLATLGGQWIEAEHAHPAGDTEQVCLICAAGLDSGATTNLPTPASANGKVDAERPVRAAVAEAPYSPYLARDPPANT